ncbi:MAG TPA: ABC transporter ATP-binding protein [Pyrinomonadaceae bacterium]|nr:ABC transporter ATP-binding protein [Pyrinomonadaceae bacterium]
MKISPTSKVQSPTSEVPGPISESNPPNSDVGHWTLDVGLRVADLRKNFTSPTGERLEVLRGVSFSAEPGEALAVTGASGAGKTTLLNLLGGLEKPDHGKIAMGEFEIDKATEKSLAAFRQSRVGFLFQFHHLLADLTALENVALPLAIARVSWDDAIKRASQLLQTMAIGERMRHPVTHLSGGEQQRVAVCRALITSPSLVLADEPTGNLDSNLALEIGKILTGYAKSSGATVIIATHNQELAYLCDRILVLTDGKTREGLK